MLDRISRGDRISVAGAIALFVGLFAPWYGINVDALGGLDDSGPAGEILREFTKNISASAFDAFKFTDVILAILAIAAVALIALVALDKVDDSLHRHVESIGAAAAGLIILRGIFIKPSLTGLSLKWGIFFALLGAIAIAAGRYLNRTNKI
jgi:hypothetical protein